MKVFAEKVVKHKKLIAILSLVLLIPCIAGYLNTRINYDMLTYLPDDIQTVQGQKILLDDFNKGSFALLIFEDMDDKDVSAAREKIEDLEYVDSALWYDSIADITVPKEILPDDIYDEFNNGDCTLMAVSEHNNFIRRSYGHHQGYTPDSRQTVFCKQYVGIHNRP